MSDAQIDQLTTDDMTVAGTLTVDGSADFNGAVDFDSGIHVTRSGRSPIQFYAGDTPPASSGLYRTLAIPGLGLGRGSAAPTLTVFRGSIQLNAFTGTGGSANVLHFTARMGHDFLIGSTPAIRIAWSHIIASPTGNVKWYLDISVARGDDTDAFAAPTTYSVVDTPSTQYLHHTTAAINFSAGQAALMEPNSIIIGRLYRDPADVADTFANNAFLLGLSIRYEVGQIGTLEAVRPYTSIS